MAQKHRGGGQEGFRMAADIAGQSTKGRKYGLACTLKTVALGVEMGSPASWHGRCSHGTASSLLQAELPQKHADTKY